MRLLPKTYSLPPRSESLARMNRMNGINRFLSRRDKHTHGDDRHKKVMSSPAVETPSRSPDSLSTSSSYHSPRTSSRHSFYLRNSSLSSLSLAFTPQVQKQFPVMQLTEGTILSSTANTNERLLLQPKQTAGSLHGLFPEEELKAPVKDDEKKVCPQKLNVQIRLAETFRLKL